MVWGYRYNMCKHCQPHHGEDRRVVHDFIAMMARDLSALRDEPVSPENITYSVWCDGVSVTLPLALTEADEQGMRLIERIEQWTPR